jgi:pimeloyl-ACP methyl ester carboxylesterase
MAQEQKRLTLWQGKVETEVEMSGDGPALLYLHGPWGLMPDLPFIARLSSAYKVFAPRHPGTSNGAPDAAHAIDTFWDLVVYYGELMDRLDLKAVPIVGHSFGGLVGAEIAAAMPERAKRLVIIDPVGLWRDDRPVKNWMIMPDAARPQALFANPAGEAARKFFGHPEENDARVASIVAFIWAQACTGKYIWPLPDKGLGHRIHRIAAPTLIVWGKQDGIIAPVYAQEFANRISGSRVELIDEAGHLPHLERGEEVSKLVGEFLRDD